MNGLGFLIWQLANMPPVDDLIPVLQAVGCKWISIKVANGIYKYNAKTGDAPLKAFIQSLQGAGFEVGGWHYTYPQLPGPQGDLAEERREKLGLQSYLLDVEGEWKGNYARAARTLCNKLHNGVLDVGLCSFRYIHLHPEIPWSAFINHERVDSMTPQVYWIGSHNPGEQLIASEVEYTARTSKPFIPIGATFSERGWEPTTDDLTEFVNTCEARGYPAYGFYSLDWIIVHQRNDWLKAIHDAGGNVPPPGGEMKYNVTQAGNGLKIRSTPFIRNDNILGTRATGSVVTPIETTGDSTRYNSYWVRDALGWSAAQWYGVIYMEPFV